MRRARPTGTTVRATGTLAAAVLVILALAPLAAAAPAAGPVPPVAPPVPPLTPSPSASPAASSGGEAMVGTFGLTGGSCTGAVHGSYFRMIQPGGAAGSGPYVQNSDSPCADNTYTPLAPGHDGGLVTGSFQSDPDPAFDKNTGGGRADRITRPQRFYGVDFSTATNPTDPQTGIKVSAPAITRDTSGHLSGDVRAFAASWNNQHFNQGSPKPDGSRPGTTAGPTGTYNSSNGAYTIDWTSQIVGGPFNNFTGQWHFEGTFSAPGSGGASSSQPTGSQPSAQGSPSQSRSGSSGGGAGVTAAGGGVAPDAFTGPSLASWVGLVVVGMGMAGLTLARRAGRPAPGDGRG